MIGSSSIGHSIPRSPRATQDGIRAGNHFIDLADGFRAFDLGEDAGAAPVLLQNLPQLIEVAPLPGETQCDELHSQFRAERHIGEVLFGQRRQVNVYAREIDVTMRAERPGRQHLTTDAVVALLENEHLHHAIIEQHGVA